MSKAYKGNGMTSSTDKEGDIGIDYITMGLNADQYGALKNAFEKYDKMKTGTIKLNDFEQLSMDLGEEFDDEEMQVAKQSLEEESGGLIRFSTFLKWWMDIADDKSMPT
jgi:Ca2+-binding EF-hand superfamily protein